MAKSILDVTTLPELTEDVLWRVLVRCADVVIHLDDNLLVRDVNVDHQVAEVSLPHWIGSAISDLLSPDSRHQMLTQQNSEFGLGWILDRPHQFSHWGSSGTLMWADQKTGVVGVFFSQIQDFQRLEQLRERFRDAVTQACAPK